MRTQQEIHESGYYTIPEAAAAVGLSACGVAKWLRRHKGELEPLLTDSSHWWRPVTLLHRLAVVALHPMNKKKLVGKIWTEGERIGFDAMRANARESIGQILPGLHFPEALENVKDFQQAIEWGIFTGGFVTAETIARKFGVKQSSVARWLASNFQLVAALHAGTWRLNVKGRPVDVWLSEIELYFDEQTRNDWRGTVWPYVNNGMFVGGAVVVIERASNGKRSK